MLAQTPRARAEPSAPGGALRPGTRLYAWLLAGVAVALVAPTNRALGYVLASNLLVLGLFIYDAAQLKRARLHVERELSSRLHMGSAQLLRLRVESESRLTLRVRLREVAPTRLRITPTFCSLRLSPHARAECGLEVLPLTRGPARFEQLYLRIESVLGLASHIRSAAEPLSVHVLPSAAAPLSLERTPRRELGGVAQRLRKPSAGGELESLREYVDGDPLRAVDWKATARRHRPVTRLYRPERSQTLWLVLDASRTMAHTIGPADSQGVEKTRFDVALEIALALAAAALRAGDQVGALVYGDARNRLIPPGRGRAHFRRLFEGLHAQHPAPVALAVHGLLQELSQHAKRRAMLVLFTDLENESHAALLCEHAPMLTRRHLPVCVSLLDTHTQARAQAPAESELAVYVRAAAVDLLSDRERLRVRLEQRGIPVLEADVRGLARRVLDSYLRAKLHARL